MIRVFIAAGISHAWREYLHETLERWRKQLPGIRWVVPENLHLTLAFLGPLAEDRLALVNHACSRAASTCMAFSLQLGEVGFFPETGLVRVIWLGISDGQQALQALQAQVAQVLGQEGFALDARAFVPHLTLGRAGANEKVSRARLRLPMAEPKPPAWMVTELLVMRSELSRAGDSYSLLSHCPLHS